MADLPLSKEEIANAFGPHLKYDPPGGWEASAGKPDKKGKAGKDDCHRSLFRNESNRM